MTSSIVYVLQCHNQENAPKVVATYKKSKFKSKDFVEGDVHKGRAAQSS